MPRITRVTWPAMKMNYGWLFDIRTVDELFDYLDNVRAPRARAELSEALKYAQGIGHANMVATIAEIKGIGVLDAQLQFNADVMKAMEKNLFDKRQIFVNGLGGHFPLHDGLKLSDSRMIDVWALPEEKPRFIQWPGGTHYYAKIGDEDIVVDGKQKWDTKEEAEEAAKKFMKGKRR